MKQLVILLVFSSFVAAQTAPDVRASTQPPSILQRDQQEIVKGTVIAYDWSTRYYMEGARVDRFIFRVEGRSISAGTQPLVRVVLLWHPADKPRIIPKDFRGPHKQWQLTLKTTTPFDFVRQYCTGEDAPTFPTEIGNGRQIELPRYVNPAALPPDVDLSVNFRTAIARRPASPEMPEPRSLPCLYLENVKPVGDDE